MGAYEVTARNFSEASENRIHSDEIAKKFGFRGALVPGVAVYGHATYPLVEAFGEDWLSHSVSAVRLLKPTYHGDALTVAFSEDEAGAHTRVVNQEGTLIATLDSHRPDTLPAPEHLDRLDGSYKHPERIEIAWDNVMPDQPFAPWRHELTAQENHKYTSEVADSLALYGEYVHPHQLLSLANTALMNEYVMPTWLHVGSETRHRAALKVGDTISVRSVPVEKWTKKGHEFIRLWVTFWRDEELTTDIFHTAIFKVAA